MAFKLLTIGSNGRFLLIGGRPISPGGSDVPITLVLKDIYTNNRLAHPVIQRKAGTDYGEAPVMFSYTGGAPSNVQARIVDISNPTTVIKDWTTLTSLTVNESKQMGLGYLLNVPMGCNYQTQIRDGSRPNNASTNSVGSRGWGVGVCIFIAGQSNMLGTLDAGEFDSPIPGTSDNESSYWTNPEFTGVYWGIDGFVANWTTDGGNTGDITAAPGWGTSAGGGTGFLRMVAANLKAKYGRKIPVCGAVWAFGATGLGDMFPPATGDKVQIFSNNGTSTGKVGWMSPPGYTPVDFEGIILHQGEAEAGFISRADRLNQLKAYYTFMLTVVAPHGRTAADLFFRPAILGAYANAGNTENIRAAVYDLEVYAQANGWPRVKAGWNCIDLDADYPTDPYRDGLHFHDVPGGPQFRKMGLRRVIQTVAKEMGATTFTGMGPKISGATRNGNVVSLTVAHEGGNALATRDNTKPLSGWYANSTADFSGNNIAVTATIANTNTINVTLPSGTTYPVYVKYAGGKVGTLQSQHPDVSNPVYDNAVYPANVHPGDQLVGLPLQPTVDSIVVN